MNAYGFANQFNWFAGNIVQAEQVVTDVIAAWQSLPVCQRVATYCIDLASQTLHSPTLIARSGL